MSGPEVVAAYPRWEWDCPTCQSTNITEFPPPEDEECDVCGTKMSARSEWLAMEQRLRTAERERDEWKVLAEQRAEDYRLNDAKRREELRVATKRADAALAPIEALLSALDRTEANFIAAVNGKPVRDMTETLAENQAARDAAKEAGAARTRAVEQERERARPGVG